MTQPRYPHPSIANEPPVVIMRGIKAELYFTMASGSQPQNLIDGLLYASPPPTEAHENLVAAVVAALRVYGREHGGRVIAGKFPCWLSEDTVILPDAGYVEPKRAQLVARYLQGAPDLAIEVLAPGTTEFDTEAKFTAYGRHGVHEAWFVDPEQQTVAVVNGDGAAWQRERRVAFGEVIPSEVVDVGAANLSAEVGP